MEHKRSALSWIQLFERSLWRREERCDRVFKFSSMDTIKQSDRPSRCSPPKPDFHQIFLEMWLERYTEKVYLVPRAAAYYIFSRAAVLHWFLPELSSSHLTSAAFIRVQDIAFLTLICIEHWQIHNQSIH